MKAYEICKSTNKCSKIIDPVPWKDFVTVTSSYEKVLYRDETLFVSETELWFYICYQHPKPINRLVTIGADGISHISVVNPLPQREGEELVNKKKLRVLICERSLFIYYGV